ncbi:MAG: DUF938 domain-containing protein [Haliangiales bacterium]
MKHHAPATLRNREPIAAVLARELPAAGLVLEIASGSGEHARYFAERFPQLSWQPSDVEPRALASIAAWREDASLPNLAAPIALDVTAEPWSIDAADALLCCNMIHIAPWEACEGLLAGAGRLLASGQPLCLYGPFIVADTETAPSNLAFDRSLRARDSRWGIRDLDRVSALAAEHGLELSARHAMPANNLLLVFRKLSEVDDSADQGGAP